MQFIEKPIIQRLLAAGIIIWFVLGAGLWAHFESIPAQLEPSAVRAATLILENGKTVTWQATPIRLRFEADKVHAEVSEAAGLLQGLGALKVPVHLRINFQNAKRFRVQTADVEVGVDVATTPGQIRHALVKAWLLQNADLRFSSSVFRQNVLADALFAVTNNGIDLQNAKTGDALLFDENQGTFFEQIGTLASTCLSKWVPSEILQLCEQVQEKDRAGDVYALSVRRAVSEAIWKSIEELSAFERVEFMKRWLTYLQTPTNTPDFEFATGSVEQWRRWAKEEFEVLLPKELLDGTSSQEKFASAREAALRAVQLDAIEGQRVDLVARFNTSEAAAKFATDLFERRIQVGMPALKSVIVGVRNEFYILPGGAKLTKEDLTQLRSPHAIWESCEVPTVQELLHFPVKTDRTLVVQLCEDEIVTYRSLVGYGVEGFAIDNPGVHFVQIHRPSLEFAAEKGLLPKADLFNELLAKATPKVDRKLGLAEPQWDAQLSAFRVNGVIEAIEWFRGKLTN